jgi:hypothetical protein
VKGWLTLAAVAPVAASLGGLLLGQPALASQAHAALQPWPVTITIRTVPALPGVRFSFDGMPLVTGSAGTASVTERHNFGQHTLGLADTRIVTADRRYVFARWAGQRDPNQAFRSTVRGLPMRASYTVTASFGAACPVTPRLTEQDGTVLGPGRVARITLRSNLGQSVMLQPSGTTWLPCSWPVYQDSLLSSRNLQYSVQSVLVGGTNVAYAGIQRFQPSRTPHPTVIGLFHTLTITAHDALFGGGMGNYALLTMPDHTVRRVMMGRGHSATVRNLPQGDYQVDVKAGGAIVSAQTIRLSRSEKTNLTAVSRGDLSAVGGALVIGVAGLPLVSSTRRRRLLALLRPRKKAGVKK